MKVVFGQFLSEWNKNKNGRWVQLDLREKCYHKIFINLLIMFSHRPSITQSGMSSISEIVKPPWSLWVTAKYLPFSKNIKSLSLQKDEGENTHNTTEKPEQWLLYFRDDIENTTSSS